MIRHIHTISVQLLCVRWRHTSIRHGTDGRAACMQERECIGVLSQVYTRDAVLYKTAEKKQESSHMCFFGNSQISAKIIRQQLRMRHPKTRQSANNVSRSLTLKSTIGPLQKKWSLQPLKRSSQESLSQSIYQHIQPAHFITALPVLTRL